MNSRISFDIFSYMTLSLVCCVVAFSINHATAQSAQKPNVIVILMDDMGYGDLSVTGNKNSSTPHIDQLSLEGVSLDEFYVCPVCAPTRAEFLTGRFHLRGGVHGVSTGQERLNLDEITIADAFKQAGYATGLFGKWHNGSQYPYHPNGRGFDEFYGFTSGHWGQYFDPILEHNSELTRGKGHITTDLTSRLIEWMESQHQLGTPFFGYLAYNVPHSPMQAERALFESIGTESIVARYHGPEEEDIDFTRAALAMVKDVDRNIARLLESLKTTGIDNNTIIVYFSDNGPNSWRFNDGMKGRKGSTNEGGVRVPCFVRWPGHLPAGGHVAQLSGAVDLFPTLCSLCEISPPDHKPWDGINLAGVLKQPHTTPQVRNLLTHQGGKTALRSQQFLLDENGNLYDRISDKGQTHPLNDQHPDVHQSMIETSNQLRKELGIPYGKENRPFPVGYQEFPVTRLPSRDAKLRGVQFSAKAPNCSYLTNWKKTSDEISFPIDVKTTGNYDVVMHYCCPEENLGSVVVISAADHQLRWKITEPFDSPLVGAADDLVERKGESYVKDFKAISVGQLKMDSGVQTLRLTAERITGSSVAEIRWVELRLKP